MAQNLNYTKGTIYFSFQQGSASTSWIHTTPSITLSAALIDLYDLALKYNALTATEVHCDLIEVSQLNTLGDSRQEVMHLTDGDPTGVQGNFPCSYDVSLLCRAECNVGRVHASKYIPFPPSKVIKGDDYLPTTSYGGQQYDTGVISLEVALKAKWGILAVDKITHPRVELKSAVVTGAGAIVTFITRTAVALNPGDYFVVSRGVWVPTGKNLRGRWQVSSITPDAGGGSSIVVVTAGQDVSVALLSGGFLQPQLYGVFPVESFQVKRPAGKKRGVGSKLQASRGRQR